MIPIEVAALADLIWEGWLDLPEDDSVEVLKAAWRVWNAGYRTTPRTDQDTGGTDGFV